MAKFLLRVVLHEREDEDDIPATDYSKLHAELKADGFLRTIQSDNGIIYNLPPAEYRMKTSENPTIEEVRGIAAAAVRRAKLRREFSVLVLRYTEAAWRNLTEV